MLNRLHLTLLFLLFHTSPLLAQDYFNEKVKFILDSWKYNFGWETFGGGYIRHFLLFTDSNIVVIKTNHISHTPKWLVEAFSLTIHRQLKKLC